jgi:Cysteine-rich CWC
MRDAMTLNPSAPASAAAAVQKEHACPICGQANACAVALAGSFDRPCWCRELTFTPAVLARVPEARRGKACVCRACAQAGKD